MKDKSPLFSIVIPTRNRAHLLRYALQSVLEQKFDDLEIVVSDNYCSDNTPDVVRELADKRVHHFRTERALSMPDSWEFALSKARGEWITFLADDCAICPRMLEALARLIPESMSTVLSWSNAGYFQHTWYEPNWQNRLVILPFTGRTRNIESKPQLTKLFAFYGDQSLPRMLNSCCHREVIENVRRRVGRFFGAPCPDYSSCAAVLAVADRYSYVDIPLMVCGTGKESIGDSFDYNRGSAAIAFFNEFNEEKLLAHVPFHSLVTTNLIAESLLRVKETMRSAFAHVELDWKCYFSRCYQELACLDRNGVDVDMEKKQLFTAMRLKSDYFRASVYLKIGQQSICGAIRRRLRDLCGASHLLTSFVNSSKVRQIVRGNEHGVSNVLEAARLLDVVISEVQV